MIPQSPYTAGEIICADRERNVYLVKNDNDFVFESWSSSTKRPDVIYKFSKWENKSHYIKDTLQIYQWILFIASDTLFPIRAREIALFAEVVYFILNG